MPEPDQLITMVAMEHDFVLRPVRTDDLKPLQELIRQISGGMTSLPVNTEHLAARIDDSLRAFDPLVRKPGGESYLFVLEDRPGGRLIGTSGIVARVGGFDPFYTYEVKKHLQEYEPLNIHNSISTLELVKNHKGPTEVCSLFLHPDYRRHGVGKLLSISRFFFIKAFPDRFDTSIIVELRGFIDESGKSPFWEAVGKNFFWKDYYEADVLSGIGEKDFIEALMPTHPIYVNLLPATARDVIGKVHPQSEPAMKILLKEGFSETNEVDIFDAGPILQAERNALKSWKAFQKASVEIGAIPKGQGQPTLLAAPVLEFRASLRPALLNDQGNLLIDESTASALGLGAGDEVIYMFLQ